MTNIRFRTILLSLIIIIWGGLCNSDAQQQPSSFTLQESIDFARENSKKIKSAMENVESAKGKVNEAISGMLPQLSANGSYTYFVEPPVIMDEKTMADMQEALASIFPPMPQPDEGAMPPTGTEVPAYEGAEQGPTSIEADKHNYQASLSLQQPLFTWGKIYNNYKQAKLNLQAAELGLENARQKLDLEVTKAFYGVVLAQEFVNVSEKAVAQVEKHVKTANDLFDAGVATNFDVLRASVQLANVRSQLIKAKNALRLAKEGFKITLGLSPETEVNVDGKLEYKRQEVDLEELLKSAMENRPDLKQLELQGETSPYVRKTFAGEKTEKEKATLVETAPVEVGDITQKLSLVGDIEAWARVFVFAKIPGKIKELKVDMGDSVKKGDVLAVVEHEELALNVRQAKAALKAAKAGFNQAKKLSKIKVMSQVRQAEAGLAAAKAGYEQVKELSFTRTETQMAQAEAGLEAIKANLKKIKEGAREEEKEQVEATVEQAKAGLDNAKANYQRMKKLFEQGAISQQTFDGIETQYNVAKAQYEAAKQQLKMVKEGARKEDIQAVEAQVKQAEAGLKLAKQTVETKSWKKDIARAKAQVKQASAALETAEALKEAESWKADITNAETAVERAQVALELAQKKLADATITAPISGIVSQRNVDLGDMVSPKAPAFEVVSMDVVKAMVSVIESDLYKISVGDEAMVNVDALSEPVKGEVTKISPTLDKKTRNADVEITVQNPEHKLRPGMFAEADVITEKHTSLLVPTDAVFEEDGEHHLYVVNNGKATLTPVQVGVKNEDKVEIINGVKRGDTVIVSGQIGLPDGAKVQAKSATPPLKRRSL